MVELGDKVMDPITGLEGVAVCIHNYLHGCIRITVQQKIKKDGTVPDTHTFDAPQLKVLEKKKIKKGSNKTGGPDKFQPRAKPMDKR